MSNVDIKKQRIFEKSRKEKKDMAYQTIEDSHTSLDSSSMSGSQEKSKTEDGPSMNVAVNLKKSKTFKIIVNKKSKEKDKSATKKDKSKIKNKKRQSKEIKIDEIVESDKKEYIQHLFGVSLTEACKYSKSHDGYPLPAFFRLCIDYLETDHRLNFEGIYRIPGVNSQIVKLKQALNTEVNITDLLQNFDIAVVTSIVKSFLRDLQPDIISRPLETQLFKSLDKQKENVQEKVSIVKKLINEQLPQENQYLLALIISHMDKVIEMSHENKMSLENLLIVLSPALHLHFELLKFLYDHSSAIFMDMQVPSYIPPIRPGPDHAEELPETVDGINEELKKQISYLDDLHEQINQGLGTEKIEYLIWEVQLIVTNLKRKKYIAELNDPELIKNELKKYERQLKRLHKGMLDISSNSTESAASMVTNPISTVAVTAGAPSSIDQELWQVQRTITTLNRKLKSFSTYNKAVNDIVPQVTMSSKIEACNDDDDDDDSIQLNLTLRKIPVEVNESLEDRDIKETSKFDIEEKDPLNQEGISPEKENSCIPVITELPSSEDKCKEWQQSETNFIVNISEKFCEGGNIEGNLLPLDTDNSTSSNGAINTTVTEDYPGSNSGSILTGSNMATNIEDLIQTGEMWTNEKDELIPEDEDCRNEALRYLFMREELLSIRNDLKTRISSESNEILRLKRNIEELDEEREQKNFHAQNLYRKLNDSLSSLENDKKTSLNLDKDEGGDKDTSDEDDCDLEASSSDSDSVQFSEHTIKCHRVTEDDDMSELIAQQKEIMDDNDRLEKENMDLLEQIEMERSQCVELKVALRTHMLLTCSSPWPSNLDD